MGKTEGNGIFLADEPDVHQERDKVMRKPVTDKGPRKTEPTHTNAAQQT